MVSPAVVFRVLLRLTIERFKQALAEALKALGAGQVGNELQELSRRMPHLPKMAILVGPKAAKPGVDGEMLVIYYRNCLKHRTSPGTLVRGCHSLAPDRWSAPS